MSLADLQAALAREVVEGTARGRLRVHARHYEASLVRAIVDRFPAAAWLAGSDLVSDAARHFVRLRPPQRPCLAEYGHEFPAHLASRVGHRLPYLRDFAELEWRVGEVAIEVTAPACAIDAIAGLGEEELGRRRLGLQPGVRYLQVSWPVDELLAMYMNDSAPDRLVMAPTALHLEVRGARGDVAFHRLAEGDFHFRRALAQGKTTAEALGAASSVDASFDPGQALVRLFAAGLVRRER
jgi:hypothetical protein